MTASLQGARILVVEDEYLVASLIEDMLQTAGCSVAGPIPRLAPALEAAESEACDAAVLDVNLAGERAFPVADILTRRNVPFVLVTGYSGNSLPPEYAACPRLHKPFRLAELLAVLSGMLQGRRES
ncbi:MAG: response regulator [Stellaceae bacterium]